MFVVGLLMLVFAQESLQQSIIKSAVYKRIHVEGSSLHKMNIKNFIDDGAGRKGYADGKEFICFYSWQTTSFDIYSLSNILCASICTANEVCQAYTFFPRNCSLANATGLIGVESTSSEAEAVMINADLVAGMLLKLVDGPRAA